MSNLAKNAVVVITDRGYLRYQREIKQKASQKINVKYIEVDSDVIIPIEIVSKTSISYARLYRKKLEPYLEKFIKKSETPKISNKTIIKFEKSIGTIEDMQKSHKG